MSLYTVVGASGFVGAGLAAALEIDGATVYAPARGDDALFDRDLGRVIYCAGLTADYLARPFDTVEAHVSLLARLIGAGRFDRLVYLSSTRLYDSLGDAGGQEDGPLSLDPAQPRHLFDLSKALGENLVLTQAGGRGAVARLSNVFDWRPGAPGFLSQWLQQARRSRLIQLDSAPGYVRDYIHLDDAVAGLRAVAATDASAIYNVASGENLSNADLAEAFDRNGWTVAFERAGPAQQPARAKIDRLVGLGVRPRSALSVIEACLKGDDFVAAA